MVSRNPHRKYPFNVYMQCELASLCSCKASRMVKQSRPAVWAARQIYRQNDDEV
jgi:hypothetical protein